MAIDLKPCHGTALLRPKAVSGSVAQLAAAGGFGGILNGMGIQNHGDGLRAPLQRLQPPLVP